MTVIVDHWREAVRYMHGDLAIAEWVQVLADVPVADVIVEVERAREDEARVHVREQRPGSNAKDRK